MLKDKKILITGGSGFLGTNFITKLLSRGAQIRTHTHNNPLRIDGEIEIYESIDLNDYDDCFKLIDGVDYVIHVAGPVGHPTTVKTDFKLARTHLNIFSNILEASIESNVKKFLDINSSTGYPDRRYAIKEDEYWDDEPYIDYYGYGWSRRYREKLMEHGSHFSDTDMIICRGTAMFGPHDNFYSETCHVIPALINRLFQGENPFVVWGSPDVVRDFLYVEDVVDGALLALEKGKSMRPYNLGYGDTVTIGDIVENIINITDIRPEVVWDNSKPTTIPYRKVDTKRINTELGFSPKYTFYDGLEKTINWYMENIL